MYNHSQKAFTVKEGERIAQVVFMRKYDAEFIEVKSLQELGKTGRQEGGFGSTGKTVIKKLKLTDVEEEELHITCEEGTIKKDDNDEIILHEKISS